MPVCFCEFQFLIGRIKSKAVEIYSMHKYGFQFLIGRIKSLIVSELAEAQEGCFNSL